ncbi:MAG: class I tRNA ligase family protein [Patescibacteria group bacterium]
MSDIHSKTQKSKLKGQSEEVQKSQTALDEEAILKFWQEEDIFKKSLSRREGMGEYVFYDGPPFATGLPHYGHILPGTVKDVIPRYYTMKGYHVVRKWGWDCHGLPIENIIEKNLNLNSRKEIIDYGIANFNTAAQAQVLAYKDSWEKIIPRTGRWVDMEDHYKTMDPLYTESCWWAFKELDKKGLVYKGYKPMHLCPRCETTLSNNEVAEGYADITDISVTAKFELQDEPGTYLLAWTTTPWTLPGNTAIAVGPEVIYVKVAVMREDTREQYILAQSRLEEVMQQAGIPEWEELSVLGSDALVGKSYIPPFDYFYTDTSIEHHENGWKVYEADFVNDESGTGIAHEAPAFGADDYYLAQKQNIPMVHHVTTSGQFVPEVVDFAGMLVKSKEDHQSADIAVIKYLAHRGLLFSKEKIVHSYPHCWRCDTPLLNYATSSWFIATTKLREKMLAENSAMHWVPEHIGHKRFHNWIANNVDWAVSRSRFWGAPLPVWENQTTGEYEILGSIHEIQEKLRSNNHFIVIPHGESVADSTNLVSLEVGAEADRLSERGKDEVLDTSKRISHMLGEHKRKAIDVIAHSPYNCTKQTALMLENALSVKEVREDNRLRKRYLGDDLSGTSEQEFKEAVKQAGISQEGYDAVLEGGEYYREAKKRITEVIYELDEQYENATILLITHPDMIHLAQAGVEGVANEQLAKYREEQKAKAGKEEIYYLDFAPIPHNNEFELDLHRPYLDAVSYKNEKGEPYKLIGEVFDCWYESGSMPYASKYYQGENTPESRIDNFAYPADFICEAIDQTRGWFYSLLALGVGLFEKSPMKNVIVTGFVMAEDGKKMSKKLQNYPELDLVFDRYGADALRYFLLNSPVLRGESVNLSEKDIDEVNKKIVIRLKNTLSFFQIYRDDNIDFTHSPFDSPHPLDRWILSRLEEVLEQATRGLDAYELDRACAPFYDFVEDFSNWYIRRSRSRFKGKDREDIANAQRTTYFVLKEFSKIIAPFMPFTAEYIFRELREAGENESVHLELWPTTRGISYESIAVMARVRELVSRGLEARVSAGLKVRQPLASATLRDELYNADEGTMLSDVINEALMQSIREELNVKAIHFDKNTNVPVVLDSELTPELQEEGDFREFVRHIQNMRKDKNCSPKDKIYLHLQMDESGERMVKRYFSELEDIAGVSGVDFVDTLDGDTQYANELAFRAEMVVLE